MESTTRVPPPSEAGQDITVSVDRRRPSTVLVVSGAMGRREASLVIAMVEHVRRTDPRPVTVDLSAVTVLELGALRAVCASGARPVAAPAVAHAG